jgi:small nuclear ribonucleoprotein E
MENKIQMNSRKKALGPIETLFNFMEKRVLLEIWTEHNPNLKFQGIVIGFDEWMNLTLDDAKEINVKKGQVISLGKIILKGDNISVMHVLRKEDAK